ncbi:hypothetical protein CK503_06290 [Aliifodinibius salipaludis]|uniref:Glycerophosphoryl diester phosphodiesterase membrane domain-containing protein n=1 Tax=Fodinibius salipaludis TaxID=2032627 RepID=A0A2A2G9I8_9BACT|nr:hypothetical protein [Aliifodinibius salipaludis]PAU94406.1 hypothetical protein CK503_06290 [Aliifodinibius salipaludis]
MQQLSIDLAALFKFSFQQYKSYASFIIGAVLTFIVLAVVPQIYFMMRAPENPTMQTQFFSFLLTAVQLFLSLGFTKLMLMLVQDAYVTVADMFNNFRIFLSYFVASFIYGLAVSMGLFLLIAPGIWIAIRFQFFPYFIIENGDSSFTALQKSYNLSQDLLLELFVFGVAVVFLNLIGALLLGVGVIFTYPLTTMATAIIYRSLIEESDTIPASSYQT